MRVVRCKNSLTVTLSGGRIIQSSHCTDELYEKVSSFYKEDNEFEMINLLIPEKKEEAVSNARLIQFWEDEEQSSEIVRKKDAVYWKGISDLSMPMSFAEKVMRAEKDKDSARLNAYRNFWTLLSLNPDAEVRKNLFKFLEKWGMVITKSGLFIGYRNVCPKSGAQDDVFTDQHSHTTIITIGKMVTLPREECDCDSSNECSRGLHIGGTSWLEQNYFGTVGLACLVNPVDVIAVPWANASYGKLRTCAYLPIAKAEYLNGHIVPFRTDSGFEEPFVPTILYDGVMATEDYAAYTIPMPNDEVSAKDIHDRLLNIAREYMQNKE